MTIGPQPSEKQEQFPGARLSAELEAAVVRALQRDWESLNWSHLRRALKPPTFLLGDAESRLGQWTRADRTIEIARHLVLNHAWGMVVEVLKHEMAHQYADEVLGGYYETMHGQAFRRGCQLLGIDPAASGLPRIQGMGEPLPDEEARVLSRIAKLLALAESSNRNEAEAAMREAQRLMLKYNLAVAATLSQKKGAYSFRHLGEPTGRLQAHERQLASILARHFFVEAIWITVHRPLLGKAGTVLEICGTPANLEMAEHVHDFLLYAAEQSWREHRRQNHIGSDRLRRSYLIGVMRGFGEKLDAQARVHTAEGLIWVRDPGIQAFLHTRYPRQHNRSSASRAHPEAYAAGKQAGREIVLHRPIAGSPSATGARLALPSARGD
jgi:hypothetical protein